MTLLTKISASAGSGKTYSLTTEYLRTFFAGANADSILATTFTRTAAAEILGRVLKRMAEACESSEALARLAADLDQKALSAATVRAHLLRFCKSLDRVTIGTIDSFFSSIASCYRYESAIALDGSISDDDCGAAKRLRLKALRNILATQERVPLLGTIDQLQGGAAGRSVVNSLDKKLASLLPLFDTTDPACWEFPSLPPQLSEIKLASALSALDSLEYPCTHKSYIKGMDADRKNARGLDWNAFLGKGLAKAIFTEAPTYYTKEIPDHFYAVYSPLILHARSVILADLAAKTKATYHLLSLLSAEFKALRGAQGLLFFSDIPLALSQLLPELSLDDLSHRLDTKISHLMLDEFQDTDPLQWKILTPFSRRIADSRTNDGSIFWVGDVKQSIYGWRGARAAIFQGLKTDYEDLRQRELSTSFRSSQVVLNLVNWVFSTLAENPAAPPDHKATLERWCADYPAHKAHSELPGYVSILESPAIDTSAVSLETGDDDTDDPESGLSTDGSHVAYAAARTAEIYKAAPTRSIGVLTRTNAMADAILFELRRIGVPATALAGAPILSDPAAALVLAAISLADHPSDTCAAFRVLNSPLAKFIGLEHLGLPHLRDVSLSLRRSLSNNGYAATIVEWSRILAPHCDARGATRLARLVELADEFDLSPANRPRGFVEIAGDADCLDPAPSSVLVMSIHKAKGLEFDSVVLPELHKKLFATPPTMLTDIDPATQEIVGVACCPSKETRALDSRLMRMHAQNRADEMREYLCLLYVALTRARYAITLIAPAPKEGKTPPFSLMSIVRGQCCDPEEARDLPDGGALLFESGDSQWYQNLAPVEAPAPSTEPAAVRQPPIPIPSAGHRLRRALTPSSVEGWGMVRVEQLLATDSREGRDTGTILHAFFQQIEWLEDGIPDDKTLIAGVPRINPRMTDERIRREIPEFRRMLGIDGVHLALQRPILPPNETMELIRERSFAACDETEDFVAGIFDRVVIVSRKGRPVSARLVDFKTTEISETTAEKEALKYRNQMQSYHTALCSIYRLPADAVEVRLLFTTTGESVLL